MKLLYAEDEPSMAEAVVDILTYHKYSVDAVDNGTDALAFAQSGHYDAVILDVMMPGLSGLEVVQHMREEGNTTPVLLLTAKSDVEDRIQGLDCGADDYLPKPFAMGELLARVRALLRRQKTFTPDLLTFRDLSLDRSGCALACKSKRIVLSALEYRLMETLMLNQGIYLSSEDLLAKVWGYDTDAEIGTVWVYLSYLRKHLSALDADVVILVKRGIGYTLEKRT